MTEIRWYWEEDDFGISAEGHAEFNPGNDIVCSAISALLQTLWAGLEMYCFTNVEHKQQSGAFELRGRISRFKDHESKATALFNSIVYGLQLISREHPENVRIERVHGGGGNPFRHSL